VKRGSSTRSARTRVAPGKPLATTRARAPGRRSTMTPRLKKWLVPSGIAVAVVIAARRGLDRPQAFRSGCRLRQRQWPHRGDGDRRGDQARRTGCRNVMVREGDFRDRRPARWLRCRSTCSTRSVTRRRPSPGRPLRRSPAPRPRWPRAQERHRRRARRPSVGAARKRAGLRAETAGAASKALAKEGITAQQVLDDDRAGGPSGARPR